jgi:hypothetical protein
MLAAVRFLRSFRAAGKRYIKYHGRHGSARTDFSAPVTE